MNTRFVKWKILVFGVWCHVVWYTVSLWDKGNALTFRVVEFLSFQKTALFTVTSVKKSTPHNYSNLIYNMKLSEIPTHLSTLIIFSSYSDNVTLWSKQRCKWRKTLCQQRGITNKRILWSRVFLSTPHSTVLPVVFFSTRHERNLTFRGPCIVIYSYNKTNEKHYFSSLFW
jgi:hypothetical protein